MLTLIALTSYIDLTAALICFLLALISTINTRVLLSSIFLIAFSLANGYLIALYLSECGLSVGNLDSCLALIAVFGL